MASTILGRSACPECGFAHAHVKISDKENAKAYRHCPECGAQYFPRNKAQADTLLAKTRSEKLPGAPEPAPTPAAPPAPVPPPTKGYKIVLGAKRPL